MTASAPTYYDRPVLKEPVWIWSVPAYFYTGGAAGAALTFAAAARLLRGGDADVLVRRCRAIGAAGTLGGTAFLVHDLGRPERFLNMLRVFRPTSAMSVGSWVLAAGSSLAAAAAVLGRGTGRLHATGEAAGAAAGALGMPLASYTAVLLTGTSVPVWQHARRTMPVLFTASAASSAAALLELTDLDERDATAVRRFGIAGALGELAATVAVERELARVPHAGKPLREGPSGALWRAAKAATAASVPLSLAGRRSRAARTGGAVLATAGALATRYALFLAGRASARDPQATFAAQRAGFGAAEVTQQAAVTGPDGERALRGR